MSSAPTDDGLHISVEQAWVARMSRVQRMVISVAVAAFIFSCGGVLDWLVSHQYLPQISLMLAGAVSSAAVGLLLWEMLTEVHERYQALINRLQRIAELNHHIRNALQVILFTNLPERSADAINKVSAAVMRIESVLQDEPTGSRRFVGRFK